MRLVTLLAVALVLVATGCRHGEPIKGDVLITADRVFDGERVIEDAGVLVDGARIAAVAERDELKVEARRTIDLGDATLLPGFVDLHVHGYAQGLELSGLTTVRDLGSSVDVLPPTNPVNGNIRIFAAGPMVTVPSGYPIPEHGPLIALPVGGPEHARQAVHRLVDRGAAVIKVALEPGWEQPSWPMLSADELTAIVSAAHVRDRLVTAHVSDRRGTRRALDAGVDELAHMPCLQVDPVLLQEVASRRVPVVGTLHAWQGIGCRHALANATAFVEAGGNLLYGSDYGNPGIPPGIDIAELRLMRRAGLSTIEVLQAATAKAGEQLGQPSIGRIREGGPADLIAAPRDVSRDIGRLRRLVFLMRRGVIVIDRDRIFEPPPPSA